jgi:hypothetical protein
VRAEGLEPPRPKPPDPKSGVSTNSTTPAAGGASYITEDSPAASLLRAEFNSMICGARSDPNDPIVGLDDG